MPATLFPRRSQSTAAAPNTKESPDQESSLSPPQSPAEHYILFPNTIPKGAPPRSPFTIDLTELKKEFLKLQARAHPDVHPPSLKQRAEALSSMINEAYKTLQDPLRRAQYLLSLRGIDVAEDETAKVEDSELLMEVLEAREQIEEAQQEEDLAEMEHVNRKRIAASILVLKNAFKNDDLERAKKEVVRLRYWNNIEDSIHNWEKGAPVVLQH